LLSVSSIPQRLLNPELLARDRCADAQRAELGPGDLRIDAVADAAVDAALFLHQNRHRLG